jgi:hypothetical protein
MTVKIDKPDADEMLMIERNDAAAAAAAGVTSATSTKRAWNITKIDRNGTKL